MTATTTPPLWHFTCLHGRHAIGTSGTLAPGLDGFVWLTDLPAVVPSMLGFAEPGALSLLRCNRTDYRYRVHDDDGAYAARWTSVRHMVDPERREGIESVPGVLLRHWWVATMPLRAVLA